MIKKITYHPFFIKLFNWEYWPFNTVYAPLYIYWLWLCLRARSFFFFAASNPSITNGGFLMESKKKIYDLLPQDCYPRTLFFSKTVSAVDMCNTVAALQFSWPLIAKPDIGMRGLSVQKLENEEELISYLKMSQVDFLVQEFIPFENEIGIFYYRYPDEQNGYISGIVGKEFLSVKGDGTSTIKTLLQQDKRHILQMQSLEKMYANDLNEVLRPGEEKILVPYGNHARGAKFLDVSDMADEQLRRTIDALCKRIPGFYFGRMDIRYNTIEELKRGENFSVIELNGAGSEPTHIYDPAHSLFFAWTEIIRHWNILYRISIINHKKYKNPYLKFSSGIKMFKENNTYVKKISETTNRRMHPKSTEVLQ